LTPTEFLSTVLQAKTSDQIDGCTGPDIDSAEGRKHEYQGSADQLF